MTQTPTLVLGPRGINVLLLGHKTEGSGTSAVITAGHSLPGPVLAKGHRHSPVPALALNEPRSTAMSPHLHTFGMKTSAAWCGHTGPATQSSTGAKEAPAAPSPGSGSAMWPLLLAGVFPFPTHDHAFSPCPHAQGSRQRQAGAQRVRDAPTTRLSFTHKQPPDSLTFSFTGHFPSPSGT